MAFMKKDVNFGLLVLIIVSILLFSGFSVYYQTTFKDVSLEYKQKLDQLSKVTKELGAKRQELNETYSQKIRAEQDREVLDQSYKEASDENTVLRSEITSTKLQLAEKKSELDATKNLLAQTQVSLSAANSQISSLKSRVDNLKDDVDRICVTLIAAGGSDDDC